MDIRYLNEQDDQLAISRVYEESWKHAYRGIIPDAYLAGISKGSWAAHLEDGGKRTLVLLEHDTIVGTSSFCKSRWEHTEGFGEVVSIYLLPDYMGKGYGKPLLQAAVQGLKEMGFTNVCLWVLEENTRARRFYEAFGFTPWDAYQEDTIGGRAVREVQYRYYGKA